MNGNNQSWQYQPPRQPPGGVGGMPPPGPGAPPPGTSWPGAFPPGTPGPPRRPVPRWWWIAAVGITVVAVVAVVIFLAVRPNGNAGDSLRWSGFPHTMGCVQNRIEVPVPREMYDLHLPDAARVTEITLTHLEGQQLKLSIVFLKAAPRAPRAIISPINGQPMDEPGSLKYTVGFDIANTKRKSPGLSLESPSRDTPEWNYTPTRWPADHPHQPVLVSANTTGNIVELVLDLDGMSNIRGDGPFTPSLDVEASTKGPPDEIWPLGVPAAIDDQKCDWDNNASTESEQGGGTYPPPRSVTPQPEPVPSTPSPNPTTPRSTPGSPLPGDADAQGPPAQAAPQGCGVNLAAPQIQAAINSVPTVPQGWPWGHEPQSILGNFDPCATLSVALITVQGATRSSPEQALLFHDGNYVGTATPKASILVSLNSARTTDDTVVLNYNDPNSSAGDANPTVVTVRYQWQGDHVARLDPAPPW